MRRLTDYQEMYDTIPQEKAVQLLNHLNDSRIGDKIGKMDLSEEDLEDLFICEITTRRRYKVIDRILARKNKLRKKRELDEAREIISSTVRTPY